MKIYYKMLWPAFIWLAVIAISGCKEKNNNATPGGDCGYTITIADGTNTVVTYTNNCANNNIGQSDDELMMVFSSPDTKYALAVTVSGAQEGEHTIKNVPPYNKGSANLYLTSDQSKIPGALSFAQGKFTITRFKNQVADGTITATSVSAINKKTYTLTGEFKNMPVKSR